MTKIQANAVIFDWGNTLCLNPVFKILESKNKELLKVINDKGYPIDKEKLVDCWIQSLKERFPYNSRNHFGEEKSVRQALKSMGVTTQHIRDMLPRLLGMYRNSFKELVVNDPRNNEIRGVLEFLRSKGKRIAIFSNERKGHPDTWLSWAGIPKEWFVFVLTSEEVEIEKPDLRIIGMIADRIGEPVDKCVYVGDSPVNDIDPAVGYGMKAILYKPPEDVYYPGSESIYNQASSPDATISSLTELKDIII